MVRRVTVLMLYYNNNANTVFIIFYILIIVDINFVFNYNINNNNNNNMILNKILTLLYLTDGRTFISFFYCIRLSCFILIL